MKTIALLVLLALAGCKDHPKEVLRSFPDQVWQGMFQNNRSHGEGFVPFVVTNDTDGVRRIYTHGVEPFKTEPEAVDYAKKSMADYSFRTWDSAYTMTFIDK